MTEFQSIRHVPEPMAAGEVTRIARSYANTHGSRTALAILAASQSWRQRNGIPPDDASDVPHDMPDPGLKELSTSTEVAKFLHCTVQSVSDLARAGQLPFEWVHPGRMFRKADVLAFLQSDRGQKFLTLSSARQDKRPGA